MTSAQVDGAPGLPWDQLGVQSRRPLSQAPGAGAVAGAAFRSAGCGCTCVNNVPVIGPRCPFTSCAGLFDLHPYPSLQDRPLVRLRPSQGDPQSSPQQVAPGHPDSRSPPSHSCVPVLSVTNTAPLRRTSCFCSRPPARVKFQGLGRGPQEAHCRLGSSDSPLLEAPLSHPEVTSCVLLCPKGTSACAAPSLSLGHCSPGPQPGLSPSLSPKPADLGGGSPSAH